MCETWIQYVSFWGIFTFLLIDIILSSVNLWNQNLENIFYKELSDNWNSMPIYSLSFTKNNCLSNEIPITLDTWPGTVEGCNCLGLFSHLIPYEYKNKVSSVSCTYNMTRAGCLKVDPVPPQEMMYWRENKICVGYGSNPSSYSNHLTLLKEDNSKCPDGYKICGLLDYLSHYMCIKNDDNCPINDIIINTQSNYNEKGYDYTNVPIPQSSSSKDLYLHYTNEATDNYIITKFKLSEGPVCAYNSELNTNYKPYPLDADYYRYKNKCDKTLNGDLNDPRYIPLDDILKKKLYIENDLYKKVTDKILLPGYPKHSLNAKVELSYRSYFGFMKFCYDKNKFDSQSLEGINDKRETAHRIHIAMVVFASVAFAFQFTAGIIQCICCQREQKFFIISQIITVAFNVILFALSVAAFHTLNTIDLHMNCWDEYTNFGLINVTYVLRRTINCNIVILSFCLFIIIPFIVWMFSLWWEKYQETKTANAAPTQQQNIIVFPGSNPNNVNNIDNANGNVIAEKELPSNPGPLVYAEPFSQPINPNTVQIDNIQPPNEHPLPNQPNLDLEIGINPNNPIIN